jgi:phage gpG-like protein
VLFVIFAEQIHPVYPMSKQTNIFKNIVKNVAINLTDEFHKNFERKAFFSEPWKIKMRIPNHRGSLMLRTGTLRRALKEYTISGNSITWKLPYGKIHNEGGTITVTQKMKRFFWAKHFEAANAAKDSMAEVYSIKTRKRVVNKKRTQRLSEEAILWKNMAMMKIGKQIKIPKRQFIGFDHPEVKKHIEFAVDKSMKELDDYLKTLLKPKK